MKKLAFFTSILLLSTSLLSVDTIFLQPGWNLLGAGDKTINIYETFKHEKIPYVWGYDNIQKKWLVKSPNGIATQAIIDNSIDIFESIPSYMGYWVKSDSTSTEEITLQYIEDDNMTTDTKFTQADLLGKTFFIVQADRQTYFTVKYSDTYGERVSSSQWGTTFSLDINETQNYFINTKGQLILENGIYTTSVLTRNDEYLEVLEYNLYNKGNTYQRVFEKQELAQAYLNNLSIDSNVTILHEGLTYGTITSPLTGNTWLDRNLGALEVCTASNSISCYGDYYQWGRDADGHEKSNSEIVSTLATSTAVGHSNFIISDEAPHDWTIVDTNGSIRSASWNPCPTGYKVPTFEEIKLEMLGNSNDAYYRLKLGRGGSKHSDGEIYGSAYEASLWTSTPNNTSSEEFSFMSDYFSSGASNRTEGREVRCIKK